MLGRQPRISWEPDVAHDEGRHLQERLDLTVGAYAEDGTERADLVRIALQRCRAAYCAGVADAVLIGDTPSDVYAAAAHGIPAIGVATGSADAATLLSAGAVEVFDTLEDTESVIVTVKRLTSSRWYTPYGHSELR